jgi:hypothetical protein
LIFNVTFGAAWSVLVLYAQQRLGLGAIGFGLLTTVSAAGGLLGTALYGWITRRVSLGNVMRAGLIMILISVWRYDNRRGLLRRSSSCSGAHTFVGHNIDHRASACRPTQLQGASTASTRRDLRGPRHRLGDWRTSRPTSA